MCERREAVGGDGSAVIQVQRAELRRMAVKEWDRGHSSEADSFKSTYLQLIRRERKSSANGDVFSIGSRITDYPEFPNPMTGLSQK